MSDFEKQKILRDEFYRSVHALVLRDQFSISPDEVDDEELLTIFEGSLVLSRIRGSINCAFIKFKMVMVLRRLAASINAAFKGMRRHATK